MRPAVGVPAGSVLLILETNQAIEQDKRVQQHRNERNQSETDQVCHGAPVRLTVKLRGRTEAPDGAEGAHCLSARGAKQTTPHGPLQRLLDARTRVTCVQNSWPIQPAAGVISELHRAAKRGSELPSNRALNLRHKVRL